MSNKKYPRVVLGFIKSGICRMCGEPKSDIAAVIEYSYMRGDDEVYKVHNQCINYMQSEDIIISLTSLEPQVIIKRPDNCNKCPIYNHGDETCFEHSLSKDVYSPLTAKKEGFDLCIFIKPVSK